MDTGDTAWVLTSTAFVLFMTLPGLAMFYSGLVQSKSVLSVVVQCFTISAIVSLLWFVVGYSLAFGETIGWFIGTPDKAFFYSINHEHPRGNLPEIVFSNVPDDVRYHRAGDYCGCLHGTHEIPRYSPLQRRLVSAGVRPNLPLGPGETAGCTRWG